MFGRIGVETLPSANRFFATGQLIEPLTAGRGEAVCPERNPNEFLS
jgi:hypothetical protein